jgi:4-alpha-glucanotransferase
MKFPKIDHPITGTAVPLSSLKSQENFGIGEFPDLVPLGHWCQSVGIELIQLLPVNDTGYQTSPYSALSAFALHPVYLRLEDVPGADDKNAEIKTQGESFRALDKVDFEGILKAKLSLLKNIYIKNKASIHETEDFQSFLESNKWLPEYCVFMTFKDRNGMASWLNWSDFQRPKKSAIKKAWDDADLKDETHFYAFLQWQAHLQFQKAVKQVEKMGISLKGDIPIMINDDSADVWAHPELFDIELRAGSPPDSLNPEGQNWGFPIYNWNEHRRTKFRWWKQRLKLADQYYHSFRIDHVLGFFRIWATPENNTSGLLGYYLPNAGFSLQELYELGWDEGRIRWMSKAHIPGWELREKLGDAASTVIQELLRPLPGEDLFLFSPEIKGERDIWNSSIPKENMGAVADFYRNITLVHGKDGLYYPRHSFRDTRGYQSMNGDERGHFDYLVGEKDRDAHQNWENQGRELMDLMRSSTKMLVCAEDLGSIPDCVPRVLEEKNILGLKIVRWARNWDAPGQPYYPVREYPNLSVCTPAVHDTSTLRQWWQEEQNRSGFFQAIDLLERFNDYLSPDIATDILQSLLETSSLLAIFQIQELFAITDHLRTRDPMDERVNVPGTVTENNWSYKIKPSLEELHEENDFNQKLFEIIQNRLAKTLKLNVSLKKR